MGFEVFILHAVRGRAASRVWYEKVWILENREILSNNENWRFVMNQNIWGCREICSIVVYLVRCRKSRSKMVIDSPMRSDIMFIIFVPMMVFEQFAT